MLRHPITKSGNIRYFELFKISFLVAFLFAVIAYSVEQITVSSIVLHSGTWIITIMYLIQFILLVSQDAKQLLKMIADYAVHAELKPIVFPDVISLLDYVTKQITTKSNKRYLRNNVIRC